jgi:membrane fusion protein
MSTELFRREAVKHATTRLEGEVLLATPLSVRTLGLLLAGVVLAALLFASMASYARKATVNGLLVPDQGMIRATLSSPGLLQSVVVKEGDVVAAGTRLAVVSLSAMTVGGNTGEVIAKGLVAEASAARAKAGSQLARLQVELEQSHNRKIKNQAELEEITKQIALQEKRVEIARREVASGEAVAAKGFLPRREVESRRSAAFAIDQELTIQRRAVAAVERDLADINARIASIPLEIDAARAEASSAAATIRQREADAESRHMQFVTAPIAGRIAALPVSTGQALAAGGTIAVIIPIGGQLEAELLAPSRAIGFIKPGQQVKLSLQAFPYQRFGTLTGTVRTVSTTVVAPNEVAIQGLNIQEPVFRLRVALSREFMQAYGETVPLQPGMLVSADVVFDRRSLIQWLFDPIYAVGRRT